MAMDRLGTILRQLAQHLSGVYGRRNALVLDSLSRRINFLTLAIKDLQDAVRKEAHKDDIAVALARVVARIFCIEDHFVELPLHRAMEMKYRRPFCSYCKEAPCACEERRNKVSLAGPFELYFPAPFTLRMWQQHLNAIYGERNRRKGSAELINRLFGEGAELLIVAMRFGSKVSIDAIEMEYALELADTLAWTIAVANFYSIDLEGALLERYGEGCHRCKKPQCSCPAFDPQFMEWAHLPRSIHAEE